MAKLDRAIREAIAIHAETESNAKAAWAALVEAMMPYADAFIRPHGNGFKQVPLPELSSSWKAFIDDIRDECTKHYDWRKDKIAGNFRQWRFRMAKALAVRKGGELLRNGSGSRKNDGTVILTEEQATALNEALLNIQSSRNLAGAKKLAETAIAILEQAASK